MLDEKGVVILVAIIYILWFVIAGITIMQYKESLAQVKGWDKFVALVTLVIGSPFVAVGTLVSDILDSILPAGWDNSE